MKHTQDRLLWGRVARTVKAYHGELPEPAAEEETQSKPRPPSSGSGQENRPVSARPVRTRVTPAAGTQPQPLERPVYRKLARGRLPLEATIDLHGLTQGQAHGLLHRFLVMAQAQGMRHVLVITGKGSGSGGEGVLRRAVPMWLSKPEFSGLASGYEPAARTHGGEGALYIRLKKKDRRS